MSRGFQSEYLLYVKKRDEELQSVETQQGKHAGVKPLNVSCTLANVVREHGRLVIQRPGLDVSRSPSERRRKGREVKEVLNVSEGRKKKFGFPAREKEVVEKKESVGLGGQDQSGEKARSLRCATWSCDPGPGLQPSSSPVREPEPSTSNSGDWLRSIAGGSHDPDPEYEIEDVSDTDTSTSLTTTTDSEERIAKTLEERVLATHVHVESKPQDVCLPKSPANVNMPSTKSTEKKIVVESLLANRPKRIVVPKSPEDATGLSWTEETQLKKALYASLQESRLQRQTSKQSDVTDGDFPHEGSIESTGDEFQFPSSFKLDDMVVKRGRKRKLESETSSVSSMATSSAMSPTKEQPKYIKPDAFDLKKAQVRAQRKFAQGSRPNSPNITPVKIKPGVASLPVVAPCKRARTEDFLTFLCLRGTPALPSHLDFFNYPPEYTDDIASTVSTPKHSRKSFLKRDVRSNSPQSSGSSTADRRDVSDKTGDLGVKPMRLGSPPKPLKKKKKQNKEPPSLVPSVTATLKCPPKVLTPTPLKAMTQLKPRKKKVDLSLQGQVKVEEDVEEKRPRLRTLRQPLRRGGPKTRAFFLAKNARRTVRRKVKVMKTEELDDVDVVSVDLEEIQEKAAKRLRAQKVIKRTINKLRHTGKSKRNQPRSLRSSTMVQRSSTLETEPAEPIVRETRSRVSLSPSSRPAPLLPETRMKRPVGRPRTIKLDLPVSPRITRQTGPQVKPPESPSSRRSRPLRRIHVESLPDDLFDFEDPPHESRSPRRRRSDARPQNLPPRPTRTRRQSYGSSIGTRSLSSESHRSTSRESSPEKRTRSGTRSSPRIRVHPGVVEEQPSSRPVTRRSRASYSELSLDVSGFSDDPESHPKSPSVRSTASGKSVSSVSSLRYSIKSGELSPVGSRGRSEKSQAAAKNEPPALKVKFPPTDGTACMFDTPLFMPTEQEFQDPMAYIAKIRPEAEKYGMCRIQPPPSWKPDCKVHDEMRFTSQIQYIHLTHHRWGPNREKMACIKKHLKSQAVDVEQLPLIGGIELDLPRLGATIQEFGGLQHVLDKKKWNKVADVMGISKLALDRTTKLYDAYCKYLLSYDTLCKEDKERIRTQVLAEKNSEELEKEKACVIKGRSNSLCGFYRAARNTMAMWFKEDPTSEQSENEYWRVVESGRHHVAVQCGQVDTRVTGSGFPNRKENPYSRHPWNLNILANNSGSVLRHLGPIPGVTIPTLYVRMLFTSSCWSRDLHLMPYIAYMHSGSDLIWYSVAKSQHSKFREVVTEMFPERVDDTSVWLKKDMIMVPPKQLVARGVSVTRTVQKQRQFVVVFPEVYTANISCGYSISEQVNLAHPDYLPLGHHAAKMLNESAVPEQFPYEKMLISLAKNEKVPMEVLCLLVPLLEKVVEEELHYRHQLQTAGLKRSDRMCVIDEPVQASWKKRRTMDTSEEEENICEISKKICFISMVVNEAEDIIYSLPHAMPHVQKKKSLKSCKLLYRYSEDELKQLLHSAKERLTNPPEVAPKKRKCKPAAAAGSEADTATEATTSQ
ncbi:protein Jumonji-like isoform X2 [Lineus longissimus]|uniref:protein Jumonji-like isoform X2 n=1 Tax=Lineus longissimus TaxID=88925 RepID=UPI00315CB6A7